MLKNGILITVIHKEGKDKESCENYRLTLILNCGYKIYTSIICNRFQTFMAELIDEDDQPGFIKGQLTQDNISRTLLEIMQKRKESAIFLSLDTEKAFDCVS